MHSNFSAPHYQAIQSRSLRPTNSYIGREWYVGWILANTKSLEQNAGAFVFSYGTFTKVYTSESKQ